jgi:ABC-2 type transport system permease protein
MNGLWWVHPHGEGCNVRMRWWALYKKELRSYFWSPIAYVVLFVFVAIMGAWWFFWDFQRYLIVSLRATQNPYLSDTLNVHEMVLRPMFGNMALVLSFCLPLLTMRLFAEERKIGTHELLFTLPLRDWEIVLGKFAACWTVFAIMLVFTVVYPLVITAMSPLEWGAVLCSYLGIMMMGGAFIALGTFISSLTENQIVAGLITYGVLLVMVALGLSGGLFGPSVGKVLEGLNIFEHLRRFLKGVLDTRDVLYYAAFSYFFIFMTLRSLESKRWRG